jgi:Ca-activated chloride channel homolog
MRRYAVTAIVLSVIGIWLSGALAQVGTGTLRGVVRAPDGSALAGADVRVKAVETAGERRSVTNEQGEFTVTGLPAGRYTVSASRSGFQTKLMSVEVAPGRTERIALQLEADTTHPPTPPPIAQLEAPASPFAGYAVAGRVVGGVAGGIAGGAVGGLEGAPWRSPFNTEAYDRIDDNAWTRVVSKALSTFSVDVDTASYANVRRFLNQGRLPPKDAVRIEELINYFSFDYPQPTGEHPFAVTTAVDRCPWNPKHQLALIGLQARRIDSSRLPPRNLVFLIDVSGSMQDPQKLPLVKASLALLVKNLTGKDRLAIVVYAGAAGLVLPSTPGNDSERVLEALGRLEAGGSTNGAEGIRLAYRVAKDHFIGGGVNRVVLTTDGDFNVGMTNEGDLTRFIEEQRQGGVTLSVLGFGMGNLKDSTMEKLADRGNGNYSYIDSLQEAEKVLVSEAGGTLVTVAKDVKLQVEFNPRTVGAYRLVGYENRVLQDRDFNDDRKDAGDMGAGHSVTALYELIPAGEPLDIPGIDPLKYQQPPAPSREAGSNDLFTVNLRYKAPDGETSTRLSVAVRNGSTMSPQLGFAAAVAEFGMLLRDSEHKGNASYASAAALARANKGDDAHGHRAELIRLIEAADGLSRLTTSHR